MSTRDFTANVISATPVVPDGNFKDSKASGVWDINEALDLIKGGNWPNVANINPAAFVDALFQCHLYDGTGSEQTITNNIDLSGKGGLVWIKRRDSSDHALQDTERGATKFVRSNTTGAEATDTTGLTSFNSNGFTLGASNGDLHNKNNVDHVSWTFRKQPKFFDIVTYTGDGNADRQINHNLGSVPGMMIVKKYAGSTTRWAVYHRSLGTGKFLNLDDTAATVTQNDHWQTAPNATQFTVETNGNVNNSGDSYVAYLFAHNNNDGGFGEPGDQDIIKCGSYTTDSSGNAVVDLGFEPQFVITKGDNYLSNWQIHDVMRGAAVGGNAQTLRANNSDPEVSQSLKLEPNPTGFTTSQGVNGYNGIYMAIRRGGMQTPTSASDVFQATASLTGNRQSGDTITTTLDHADWHFARRTGTSYAGYNQSRITGWRYLMTDAQDGEASATLKQGGDQNKLEYTGSWHSADSDVIDYFWRRARGFLDIVTYSGGSGADTISHNLGVTPEMIWVKNRTTQSVAARGNWVVYHSGVSNGYLNLHDNVALQTADAASKFGNGSSLVAPTSSAFTVADDYDIGRNGENYIAFLMATAAGVSKVGSYTGNGSSQDIDCGFSGGNGASFVMIKNADATGSWVVFDTARGLVTGNDVYIRFDVTNAEGGGYDFIDPLESGFTINQTGGVVLNESGQKYIFWAIA